MRDFLYAHTRLSPGTTGSVVLHSTTAPWWLLVFTSDNLRLITLVQRDWWWYSSDWSCERFSFPQTGVWNGDLWISSPALYHCTMVTFVFHIWQFQVFNSGTEGLGVVLFWLHLWKIFFWTTWGLTTDFWISIPALYHCTMVTSGFHLWQFQVFTSGTEGSVVVLFWLLLWEILFLPKLFFKLGTSGSLVLHSTTAPWWLLVFTSDNFRYSSWVQRD